MKRLNKFVTPEELDIVKTAQATSGMYLSGGVPIGDPFYEVEQLRKKYGLPDGTGLDLKNGEFCDPES